MNYLIYDPMSEEEFFVQANDPDEMVKILQDNGFDIDQCKLRGIFDDEEAERMGLDTY